MRLRGKKIGECVRLQYSQLLLDARRWEKKRQRARNIARNIRLMGKERKTSLVYDDSPLCAFLHDSRPRSHSFLFQIQSQNLSNAPFRFGSRLTSDPSTSDHESGAREGIRKTGTTVVHGVGDPLWQITIYTTSTLTHSRESPATAANARAF